jgi:hypothetical protein
LFKVTFIAHHSLTMPGGECRPRSWVSNIDIHQMPSKA